VHVLEEAHPFGRPVGALAPPLEVPDDAHLGEANAARAFDPHLTAGDHLAVVLRSSRGEVALVHGPAVCMSNE
jgi:hypothetical protein